MEERQYKEKGLIENLSPRSAFKTGLISGLAIMFAIGFFVLLGIMFNKDGKAIADNTGTSPINNNGSPTAPTPTPTPTGTGEINIVPVDKDSDWIKGNKDAKISVIEFSDTECPFCQRFHATMQQVVADYGGKVNWVYRHFPLTSLHSKAPKEAEATECAGEQGGNEAFWAYTDRLFEITPANNGLLESQLPEIAQYVGLDVGKFQECLDSGKYAKKVQDHSQQAQAAGGRGTPYSVIVSGDQKVPIPGALPVDSVKALIDPLL